MMEPKRRLVLLAAAAALAGPAAAGLLEISSDRVTGSGKLKRETRTPGTFTGVSMTIAGQVEVRLGAADSVTVEADDNVLPLIETVIEQGALKIRTARRMVSIQNATVRVFVTARAIDRLHVGGSGSITAHGLRAADLQMDIGGSGSIVLRDPQTDALAVSVGGSGGFEAVGGQARRVTVSMGGSGNVKLDQLKAVHATVNLAGSGNVTLNVREALKVTIAGSGDVVYYGDPQVSKTVAGSGEVRRAGPGR